MVRLGPGPRPVTGRRNVVAGQAQKAEKPHPRATPRGTGQPVTPGCGPGRSFFRSISRTMMKSSRSAISAIRVWWPRPGPFPDPSGGEGMPRPGSQKQRLRRALARTPERWHHDGQADVRDQIDIVMGGFPSRRVRDDESVSVSMCGAHTSPAPWPPSPRDSWPASDMSHPAPSYLKSAVPLDGPTAGSRLSRNHAPLFLFSSPSRIRR
jgi:hypothetical protein